jgi:hypothetical protein
MKLHHTETRPATGGAYCTAQQVPVDQRAMVYVPGEQQFPTNITLGFHIPHTNPKT